jgi:hypothetical protein
MPDLFESNELDNITIANRVFIRGSRLYANIPEDKRLEAIKWLKDNGYAMLVKEGVNSNSLSAAMKEHVADKGEYPPEDIIKIHMGAQISMRKK